tara:strand:+ start:12348 stop:12887 length:540 start_codon:yes stop_codon:yes gene_type:complete
VKLMPRHWSVICCLGLLLLSGCATHAVPVGSLAAASNWSFDGKLGIVSAGHSGNLGISWVQASDQYAISLYGPLGITVGHISGSAEGAALDLGDGNLQQANSPEALALTALGYALPVSPMRYWVRGIPAPGQRFKTFEDGFHQLGWDVTIRRQGALGPLKIQLQRAEVKLLLVVKAWRY